MQYNETLKTIFNRKSVRDFTGEKIEIEKLDVLLKAGMAAPSARNIQPWNFILVTKREILDNLADKLPYAKMLYQSGAAIVVCGTPDTENEELSSYWVQDCSAATENILLAGESLGLGAVWTGVFPRKDRVSAVKEILGIPVNAEPLNVIAIGHPAKETTPKNKFDPGKIHYECW